MNSSSKRRAVFLDRDGVINHVVLREGRPHPPADVSDVRICSQVVSACEELRRRDFLVIVTTNQPDVARGLQTRKIAEAINEEIRRLVPLDDIFICYHQDADNCFCRKPKPGLLLKAAERWEIDLSSSFMVGDRNKDILAGLNAGCTTFLISTEYELVRENAHQIVRSLREAADQILNEGYDII